MEAWWKYPHTPSIPLVAFAALLHSPLCLMVPGSSHVPLSLSLFRRPQTRSSEQVEMFLSSNYVVAACKADLPPKGSPTLLFLLHSNHLEPLPLPTVRPQVNSKRTMQGGFTINIISLPVALFR